MGRLGAFLLILGIGSFILPLFGLQFRLLNIFGSARVIVAVVAIVLGAILLVARASQNENSNG